MTQPQPAAGRHPTFARRLLNGAEGVGAMVLGVAIAAVGGLVIYLALTSSPHHNLRYVAVPLVLGVLVFFWGLARFIGRAEPAPVQEPAPPPPSPPGE